MFAGGPGPTELIIILVIVLVIFGAGKLPQVGGNLGKAIKNFKKGVGDDKVEGGSSAPEIEEEKAKDAEKV